MKMKIIQLVILLISISFFAKGQNGISPAINVVIDTSSAGRIFEGIGAASAGASSRLLIDYPEPYRSDILDFLFKKNFGAGFQHLKVEIGSDVNSTCGTEPAFAHTRDEFAAPNYKRGYEYWLMKEAHNRNNSMLLDGLEWGAPGWCSGGFYSADNAHYIVSFIKGAKSAWGLDLNYIGGTQNETSYNRDWLVNTLRPALDAAGFQHIKIVAPEGVGWDIATAIKTDTALANAVYAIGYHYRSLYNPYNGGTPATANELASGKKLWASEEWSFMGTGWDKAIAIPMGLGYGYTKSRFTKMELWCPISSYYDNVTWPGVGTMVANTPWSGFYSLRPALWGVAHITQFAKPGWRFLDNACGKLSGEGYYLTLLAPNGSDYSIIVANKGLTDVLNITLSRGLKNGLVHVWKSDSALQFVQQAEIKPKNGKYTIIVQPGTIYSLTTTTGQTKGVAAHQVPKATSFPQSYRDSFEQDSIGMLPRYTLDQSSTFEVASRPGGGKSLAQVLSTKGIVWDYHCNAEPFTELGDRHWMDQEISCDVYLQDTGYACVYARISDAGACPPKGYSLRLYNTGAWAIRDFNDNLTTGSLAAALGTWHTVKLRCQGTTLTGFIDGVKVGSVSNSAYGSGMTGLGTGWNTALFDNLSIQSLDSL